LTTPVKTAFWANPMQHHRVATITAMYDSWCA